MAGAASVLEEVHDTDVMAERRGEWSECMTEAGFSYTSQREAAGDFVGAPEVSEHERAARSADLRCDEAVGLTESRSRAETSGIETWVHESSNVIAELEEMLDAAEREVLDRRSALSERGVEVLEPTPERGDGGAPVSTLPLP